MADPVRFHRVLRAEPRRVYRAFLDADAMANIVQERIPDVIPPEVCSLGWQESLALLAMACRHFARPIRCWPAWFSVAGVRPPMWVPKAECLLRRTDRARTPALSE